MTVDRVNGSQLLLISTPLVKSEPLPRLSRETRIYLDVAEDPLQGSSGAFDLMTDS